MVTDSELSDQFSIDTVGSHGAVKCKGLKMDYQVSSFSAHGETSILNSVYWQLNFYKDVVIMEQFLKC